METDALPCADITTGSHLLLSFSSISASLNITFNENTANSPLTKWPTHLPHCPASRFINYLCSNLTQTINYA